MAADGYLAWREDRMFKRTVLTLLVLALAVPAYWMSHRTRWRDEPQSWDAVSLSADGHVLTFRAASSGLCHVPGHVELEGPLEPGGVVVATLYLRWPTNRPCKLSLIAPGITTVAFFSYDLPDGITFVDGVPGVGSAGCRATPRRGAPLPVAALGDPPVEPAPERCE